jgi:hypothetical protein
VSRLDRAGIIASLTERIGAAPDPDGAADLVAKQGLITVAASPGEVDAAIARLKPLPGYRWVAINGADLFGASPKTIGSKVGILDATGKVLKAADLPRPKA